MSPGKKTKKQKGKTINLSSFLNESNTGGTYVQKSMSWAQEVEDEQDGYMSSRGKEAVLLPTAPRAAREPGIDEENIPTSPPYVAYLSNLPYEVDEDDLTEFFSEMQISGMRLPKDNNKLKGYGYVEFLDRQSLIDALSMTNTNIKGRRVRIEISNSSNDERNRGGRGRDSRRDNYDNPERTSGDWRSGPREDSVRDDGDSYRSRYDSRRDDRPVSDYDNKPGAWRDRENNDGGRSTGRSFRDDDRDRDWHQDRGSRDRDGDRDRGSSFGPRRNYDDRRELDWGRDSSRRDNRTGGGMDSRSEPRTRPKLNLQPRTKPVEPVKVEAEPEAPKEPKEPKPTTTPATNIFGAAKPVDTAAREREIEERLAKAHAEAKSREEGDADKRSTKDWVRRNGEGRDDKEKSRPTWRSEEDRSHPTERSTVQSQQPGRSDQRGDSRGPPPTRSGPPPPKGPVKSTEARGSAEREKEKDEVSKMPKAKDEQAPNFVASNKYSMLPHDVDPDNLDD